MNYSTLAHYLSFNIWKDFIPAPKGVYSFAGSAFGALGIGYAYGFMARAVYPKVGIVPFHYAVWFGVAFQIKQLIQLNAFLFKKFLSSRSYLEKLKNLPDDELSLKNQARRYCWKVIDCKNRCLQAVDGVVCRLFNIRPHQEIKADNVQKASFIEMCRYRIWPVFKSTLLDTVSSSIAHSLVNRLGFTLPVQTVVPLFIWIRSIMQNIILIPALHVQIRFYKQLMIDGVSITPRREWIQQFLPVL